MSISSAAAVFIAKAALFEADKNLMLEDIGKRCQAQAKDLIGHEGVEGKGGFSSWSPLADSTVEFKQAHGYTGKVSETDPLLREGDLKESIKYVVEADKNLVIIGSDTDNGKFQELGTSKMPPRSFLGNAAEMIKPEVEKLGLEVAIAVFRR